MNRTTTWAALLASTAILTACGGGGGADDTPTPPLPAATYTISGTVTGLTSTGLVLQVSGTSVPVTSGASTFTSSGALTSGTAYAVTVGNKPATQTCTVTNGTGTVASTNVTNVAINCTTDTFTVATTVSGLTGTGLMLQLNGGTGMSVTGNGVQTFTNRVDAATAYAVTVQAQPATPTQQCTVTNGTGTISANITNVTVACTTIVYNVSGTVSGLTGTLGLSVATSGGLPAQSITLQPSTTSFSLPTSLSSGVAFRVSVATQPAGQTCLVTRGAGTMASVNVSGISVTCAGNLTSPLVGTYALSGSESNVITFYADGSYVHVRRGLDDGCINNTKLAINGVEYGTYNWNSTTGLFRALNAPLNTNGSCSLFNPSNSFGHTLTKTSNTLSFVNNNPSDPGTFTATAVSSVTNTLTGGFGVGGNDFIAFLSDGTFFTASTQDRPIGVVDDGSKAGIENGCYTSTASAYTLDFSGACLPGGRAAADTSGSSGLAIDGQARTSNFTVTGDTLITATPALTATRVVVNSAVTPPPPPPVGTYTVGGTLSGVTTTGLVLLLNGGNNLVIPAGATTFTFPNALSTGTTYGVVTVASQPTSIRCSITNGSGTIASANVTNVTIACGTFGAFSLGGTVSGLTGTLGLNVTFAVGHAMPPVSFTVQSSATTFALPNPVTAFTSFTVSVSSQPTGQTCLVTRGAGMTANVAITDIKVTCATKTTSPLVGTYKFSSPGTYFTFYADGTYVFVQNDNSCFNATGQIVPGIEYGIYSWNATTSAFQSVVAPLDNSDCGLRDPYKNLPNAAGATMTKSGNTLTLTSTDPANPGTYVLTAVPSVTNTTLGSFAIASANGSFFTLFGDGTFLNVQTQDRPTGSNNNGALAGFERGCYTMSGAKINIDMSATCLPDGKAVIDTSGTSGASNNGQSRVFDFVVSGDTTVTGVAPFTSTATRIIVN